MQKWVLRQAFKDSLPASNVNRIKRGFGMPVSAWLRGHLQDYAHNILMDNRAQTRGYFAAGQVARLLDEHQRGQVDHGQRIWALLVLELWHRLYIDAA